MTFARWVFRLAGIYGLILMTPMLFLEPLMAATGRPLTRPEDYYGFVGIVVVFQFIFLTIARDPARYRPLMPISVAEKLSFGVFVWPLYLMGRTPGVTAFFATVDLCLGVLFTISWFRTRPAPV
jgi:hypothetical protein